jgi:hypothetical protein
VSRGIRDGRADDSERLRTLCPMEIEITDEAQRLLTKKGGTMSIDFIRPTG